MTSLLDGYYIVCHRSRLNDIALQSNKNFINLVLVHLREESLLPVCKKEMRERNQQVLSIPSPRTVIAEHIYL